MPLLKFIAGDGGGVPIPTQPLRILRLFKLTRMARLMKAFPELVTMIKGLLRSLRAIASTLVLIGLMVYTWAIILHMLMRDETAYNELLKSKYDYEFTRVLDCMWTLFICGTLMLDNAGLLFTELLIGQNPSLSKVLAGLTLLSYALLSSLLVLQMLIGVLCDVVSQVGAERQDSYSIGLIKQELTANLRAYDHGDGKISFIDIKKFFCEDHTRKVFKKLGINSLFCFELIGMIFPTQETETRIPLASILDFIVMCRGSNPANVQIIAHALCFLSSELIDMQYEICTEIYENAHEDDIEHEVLAPQKQSLQDKLGLPMEFTQTAFAA
jgi:hypothetical protein